MVISKNYSNNIVISSTKPILREFQREFKWMTLQHNKGLRLSECDCGLRPCNRFSYISLFTFQSNGPEQDNNTTFSVGCVVNCGYLALKIIVIAEIVS